MDLARAPRRAPLTARKKGSGYENGCNQNKRIRGKIKIVDFDWIIVARSLPLYK